MIRAQFDLSNIRAWSEARLERLNLEIDRVLERAADEVRATAEQKFTSRTGELAASISARKTQKGRDWLVQFRATAPHAHFVENGTKPHVIEAKRRKAVKATYVEDEKTALIVRKKGRKARAGSLAFKVNGLTVFARRVNHPGTKGTHFLERSVNEIGPSLAEWVRQVSEKVFE